jgi:hypothetical protein
MLPVLALLSTAVLFGASANVATAAGSARRYASLWHVCSTPSVAQAACFAVLKRRVSSAQASSAGVRPYTVGAGAASHGEAGGLTPEDLETAYGFSSAGGSGQTVAIVDAYDDPRISADLTSFDTHYGIHECGECFRVVNQEGGTSPLPNADTSGWSVEISLDVETVRAVCHGCRILLVEARTANYTNLATAENTAARLSAAEISNSYGGPEEGVELSGTASAYEHPGVVITAATGDDGWEDWNLIEESPNAPATLPDVVSVGGTTLELEPDGTRADERVWNDYGEDGFLGFELPGYATGGGCSDLFTAQPWQKRAPGFSATGCGSRRLAADVAADADPFTGLDIYDSYEFCTPTSCEVPFLAEGDWHTVGGTSLASPLIAAMYALAGGAGEARYPSLSLYGHLGEGSLYDVTGGGSGFCDGESALHCGHPNSESGGYLLDCEGTTSCDAASGYDGPSGAGAPNGLEAFRPRLPIAAITAPAAPREGVAASFSGISSTDPYPGGRIVSWHWAWGDGTESSGAEPNHTFAKSGEYQVSLTVTDEYGLSSSTTRKAGVEPVSIHGHEAHEPEPPQKLASETIPSSLGVESFKASATPDVTLSARSYKVSSAGLLIVKLSCPSGERTCSGTIVLHVHRGHGTARIATALFSLAGGAFVDVRLHLSRLARTLLAGGHRLSASVTIQASDPTGASHTTTATVSLRRARRG